MQACGESAQTPVFQLCLAVHFQEWQKRLLQSLNTVFNFPTDTFVLLYNFNSSTQIKVPMVRTATAWWTDKYVKFQNPTYQNLSHAFEGKIRTLAQYSPFSMETLVLMCGGMFMIPPSSLLFWSPLFPTFPACEHLHHIPIRNTKWLVPWFLLHYHQEKGNGLRNLFLHL